MRAWYISLFAIALTMGLFLCFSQKTASAQENIESSPAILVFPTRPEVSIKLQNSATTRPVRGRLVRFSSFELIVDTGNLSRRDRERGEMGQRVEIKRVEELHSTDGRFQFTSEDEFRDIVKKAKAAYASARFIDGTESAEESIPAGTDFEEGVGVGSTPLPGAMNAEDAVISRQNASRTTQGTPAKNPNKQGKAPPARKSSLGQAGFGGVGKQKSTGSSTATDASVDDNAGVPAEESATVSETETPSTAQQSPDGTTETYFCSNCTKEIPTSAIRTGICPHCKTSFSNLAMETPPPKPRNGEAGGHGSPQAGGKSTGGGAFDLSPSPAGHASTPPGPTIAGATPNTGTVVVQASNGFSLDAIPNWAKGGLFVLFVLVAYHMLFNR